MFLKKENKDESEAKGLLHWIFQSMIILLFLVFVNWIWTSAFPIGLWDFWHISEESAKNALYESIPIFIWGGSVTFIAGLFKTFEKRILDEAHEILQKGFLVSLIAGVFEEIIFRWILFFSAIIGVQISNFLFFGFLGEWAELPRIIYWYIAAPITNFFTGFHLDWLLYDKGWIVGAAACSANAKFRTEHAYLGTIGWLNSWFIGFFLFWIMFKFGLPAAILVHFLYDMIIFAIIWFHAISRKALQND